MNAKRGILTLVVLSGLALGAWVVFGGGGMLAADDSPGVQGAPVRRGPLRISVIERGNLKAANSVVLRAEVEGRTTILELVEEGTRVEAGQVVCRLDTSDLEERRVQQEISVQNAVAANVKALQNFEIQKSQNESDTAKARRDLEFAKIDLQKYLEGDAPQERQELDEAILLVEEQLTLATQDLAWSERLAANGFLEKTQLDADRLAKNRQDIELKQAKRALELFDEYEFPRQRSELQADVEEAERELERARLEAEARLVDYKSDVATTGAKLKLEREKLSRLDTQIEKATLVAPVAGMVVYAQEEGRRFGGGQPLQQGAEVHEGQEIIHLPTIEGMVVEAKLHESVLEKVQPDMPCIVSVDAVPDTTFHGRVRFKAELPDQNTFWANPDLRVYRTEIALVETDPRLRTGMSCSVEVLVDDLDDVLYVPVQAVFLDGNEPVCFVSVADEVEKRSIQVGQNNSKWVEVTSGVAEGETVLLSQPAGFHLAPAGSSNAVVPEFPPAAGGPSVRAQDGDRSRGPGGRPGAQAGRPGAATAEGGTPGGPPAGERSWRGRDGASNGGGGRPGGGAPGAGSPGQAGGE